MDINAWTIVGVAIAALGVLVAVYFGLRTLRRQFPRRELRYTVRSIPLLSSESAAAHYDLRVLLGGRELRDPFAVTVALESRSRADISSASFDAGQPIRLTSSIPMHVSDASASGQKSIGIEWGWTGEREDGTLSVSIPPQLIRPKSSGYFYALTEGRPEIVVDSPLVDITVRESSGLSVERARRWEFVTSTLSLALGAASAVGLFALLKQ